MYAKDFDAIEKADIDQLVTNQVTERRTLDYKQSLPGGSDGDKKEFLADVSSFANASGGYLIFGIRDRRDSEGKPTGVPEIVEGLDGNADQEILRLGGRKGKGVAHGLVRVLLSTGS